MHGQRHLHQHRGVIVAPLRQAGHDHVGVADGLDLLEPELIGQPIEIGEQLVQHLDRSLRRESLGEGREVDNVREEDRCLVEVIGDHPLSGLQTVRYGFGQDVAKQRV